MEILARPRVRTGLYRHASLLMMLFLPSLGFTQSLDFFVEQNGEVMSPDVYGVIEVERAPFTIVVSVPENLVSATVYMKSSRWPGEYVRVSTLAPQEIANALGGTGMAEGSFTGGDPLLVSDHGWHVWPFEGPGADRWQRRVRRDSRVLGYRPVAFLYDTYTEAELAPAQWPPILYLSCLLVESGEGLGEYTGLASHGLVVDLK